MVIQQVARYGLDKSSKKFLCPSCKQKSFVKMKDYETGEYFPNHVGRCDRESNCGYHYTAKQYAQENGIKYEAPITKKPEIIQPEQVDYMPSGLLLKSMSGIEQSNFTTYLTSLFGRDITVKALEKYAVGRSKMDDGKACIFWNVDLNNKIRTGKIICYDPLTGKRNKDIKPKMVHMDYNKDYHLKLCFFGEHLLSECQNSVVCITESEKTAIIASIYMPDKIWLATGGASGCKWREHNVFSVLKNRQVNLFPDFGYYNKQSKKTCYEEWLERAKNIAERMPCEIKVSRVLEDNLSEEERVNDYDLADMLVKRDNGISWALTDEGYPIMWDLAK